LNKKTILIISLSIALAVALSFIGNQFITTYYGSVFGPMVGASVSTLYYPQGIALNATHVFVSDTQNSRIQIFDATGDAFTLVDTYSFPGSSITDGSLYWPRGLWVGTENIFIADTFANVVKKYFVENGTYRLTIGTPGTGSGELYQPSGIFVNGTRVFVADTLNNRVSVFNGNTGAFILSFGTP